MPLFVKDEQATLFMHAPRAGGTTFKVLFEMSGYQTFLYDPGGENSINRFRTCSPQHMHAEPILTQLDMSRLNGSFTMVRHPFDRLVSEYRFRLGRDLTSDAATFEAWTSRVFVHYRDNPFLFDNHIRPQHEFLLPGIEVCRFENGFDHAKAQLKSALGLSLTERQVLARSVSGAGESRYSVDELEMSDRVRGMVAEFYAGDFERFGYEP